MLSSEFNQEMGSLIRSLEQRIRVEPELIHNSDPLFRLEQSIIALVSIYLELKKELQK